MVNTLQDQWENELKRELKTDEIKKFLLKKNRDEISKPILLTEVNNSSTLKRSVDWQKPSQSYLHVMNDLVFEKAFSEDLEAGVKVFYFTSLVFAKFQSKIMSLSAGIDQLEFICLDRDIISAQEIHHAGGDSIHEMTVILKKLIDQIDKSQEKKMIGLHVDAQFFSSIAKLRAMRLIIEKLKEIYQLNFDYEVISLVSKREWTLFDKENNILRLVASVSAGLIGGADKIQTISHLSPFWDETDLRFSDEEILLSTRISRNVFHVLSLESSLGFVQDASAGSYSIDQLTDLYAEEVWKKLGDYVLLTKALQDELIQEHIKQNKKSKLEQFETKRLLLTGVNDYPNQKEVLRFQWRESSEWRVSRGFEALRHKVQTSPVLSKINIFLDLKGDESVLNARISFVKNYFESVGFRVVQDESVEKKVIVVVAEDNEYERIYSELQRVDSVIYYFAGKGKFSDVRQIFSGQNIFGELRWLIEEGLA